MITRLNSAYASIEGSTVAVFGIGCVGLSILQGAREKKCTRVFAIDTNPKKAEWAKKFGASKCDVPVGRFVDPQSWR